MKREMRTVYVAEDGKMFASPDEAAKHELTCVEAKRKKLIAEEVANLRNLRHMKMIALPSAFNQYVAAKAYLEEVKKSRKKTKTRDEWLYKVGNAYLRVCDEWRRYAVVVSTYMRLRANALKLKEEMKKWNG